MNHEVMLGTPDALSGTVFHIQTEHVCSVRPPRPVLRGHNPALRSRRSADRTALHQPIMHGAARRHRCGALAQGSCTHVFRSARCREEADTRQGALKKLMGRYFRYNAVVSMQWLLFGSNGHHTAPVEGQLQGFQRCTGVPSREMKCFANSYWFQPAPHSVFKANQVHQSVFRCGTASCTASCTAAVAVPVAVAVPP